jgi:predicted DNA-binding protein
MGLSLGSDLHNRLKNYAVKNNLKMAQIIKLLVKSYLDEMENNENI